MVNSLILLALLAAAGVNAQIDVAIEAAPHTSNRPAVKVAGAAAKGSSKSVKGKTHRLPQNRNYNKVNAFVMPIDLGHKKVRFNAVVDTASSNLFVGCGKTQFVPQNKTVATQLNLDITYNSDTAAVGPAFLDQAKFATGAVVQNKLISAVDPSKCGDLSFSDGVVGFGPPDLSNNFNFKNGSSASNVFETPIIDLLKKQKVIKQRILGVSLEPSSSNATKRNGLLTFGGVNKDRFEGELEFVKRSKTFPASLLWGVDLAVSTVDKRGKSKFLSNVTKPTNTTKRTMSAVVDSATTLIALNRPLLNGYFKACNLSVTYDFAKASSDVDSTLPAISKTDVGKVCPLVFHIGKKPFTFLASDLIAPQKQVGNADPSKRYLLLLGLEVSEPSLPVVLGQKFLERTYVSLDSDKNQIGFARGKFGSKPIPSPKRKSSKSNHSHGRRLARAFFK